MDSESLFFIAIIFAVLAMTIVGAWLLYDALKRIPPEHRKAEPFFGWLTLIPIAGVVFLWILLPFKVPESFDSYIRSEDPPGAKENDDYGRKIGLWTMISCSLLFVPFVNAIAAPVFIILFLIYITDLNRYRHLLPENPTNPTQFRNNKSSARYSELAELKKLLDDGALTQDEFETEKKKILANIHHS